MAKELYVNSSPSGVEVALLEDRQLVELHKELHNSQFTVGDIFLGRVKKLIPGLNAAFVDVGYERDAFLHYTDLGPNFRSLQDFSRLSVTGNMGNGMLDNFELKPEIIKTGKVKEVLTSRKPILVQILKEPISTKGPRLSCEIAIPGRYLVLTPFNDVIGISKRIGLSEERKRLQRLIESIRPKHFGVVVRTAAEGKSVQDLHQDLTNLINKWQTMAANLKGAAPVKKVLSELDKTSSILRDLLDPSFNKIVTNDKALSGEIETYINKISPESKKITSFYQSPKPLYDNFGITKQIKSLFGKTVSLPSGAYLVIEHTEALHVVDVNSGQRMATQGGNQESNALAVNLQAADEIARQLRLRDLGGIIIIDFIDMKQADNRKKLYKHMKDKMQFDRAKHTVLPVSRFGLMQITRQRARPEVNITTQENCPTCNGSGKIEASILLTDDIEMNLDAVAAVASKFRLVVHPYIEAYLKKGLWKSKQVNWWRKYKKWIPIHPNSDYQLTEYHFYDEKDEEIKI